MTDAQTYEVSAVGDQPTLDISKLPDQPKPPTLDISKLPDLPDEVKPRVRGEDPYNAVIRAPHDEETYNDLLRNATSDEDLLYKLYGKTVVDAIKRLYSPDTTSPKAVAAAQNAIAVSELTGFKVSPAAYLENPDAYNDALFGTGHVREKIVMGLASMLPMLVEGTPTGAAAEGVVDTVDAIASAWRAWRAGLWSLPLGIAGFTAEENANALIRSYIEGKPFLETKPYSVHDILPPQTEEGTKAVVDLLDMFGKSKAMHAGFEGLAALWDAMAYDKVSRVVPAQKLYIPADVLRRNFGAGTEGNAGDYCDMLRVLNLSPGQIRDASKYGLDVEVPLSAIVTSSDAPWFGRLKNFLRISPGREVTEYTGGKPEIRPHVPGELKAPEAQQEAGTATAAIPVVGEVHSPPVRGQTFKNSDDYLHSLGFGQGMTPRGKDYDALVPFINLASEKYGVPADIVKAVVWKESNFDPDIVCGKRADASQDSGAMQSNAQTAGAMGGGDALDAAQHIEEGTKYLRTLYDMFGDWGKALAAHNSEEASKFLADNPEAKVEDAPNYSTYVKPVLDAAEKFRAGGEPAPGVTNPAVWERREKAAPKGRSKRFVARTEPVVGGHQGEYVRLSETPEFKNWFGDSKVVFKEGESAPYQNPEGTSGIPRMVYYSADPTRGDLFHPDERGVVLFSSHPEEAPYTGSKEAESVPAYLKIENPLEIKSLGVVSIDAAAIDKAKEQGNDGIIADFYYGLYLYAVFSPNQIKSPLNRGIFNPSEADTLIEAGRSHVQDNTVTMMFRQIEDKPVELIGLLAQSHADLAVLAQGWRNPNYEELRYVYTRQGVIVDHEGVTCRLPMKTRAFLGDRVEGIKHIKERIAALGADALYLVHNHPSGNVEPSAADVDLTVSIAKEVPEMKGQIIINSGEYAFIEPNGDYAPKPHPLPGLPEKWVDPILTASVPHKILDQELRYPWDIAAWAKVLTAERNKPLIVYLSPKFFVRGLQEINPGGSRDWKQLADMMPKKLVDFGSKFAVLILPERSRDYMFEIGETLVRRGVFYDVVSVDKTGPHSVLALGTNVRENVFGGRPLSDFPAQPIR